MSPEDRDGQDWLKRAVAKRNTISSDFVHYVHTGEAKDIAKLLGLTQCGRHAVVINVEPDMEAYQP